MWLQTDNSQDDPLHTEFRFKCDTAYTLEDFYYIAECFTGDRTYPLKNIYNDTIGWALPSRTVIQKLYEAWQEHSERYPDANFVDFGAGTGVFCHCMQLAGIPGDRIIAFDIAEPTHAIHSQRKFYPVRDYTVKETDFVFIGWGFWQDIPHAKTICILGELTGGCTLEADYFRDPKDDRVVTTNTLNGITWNITMVKAIGPASRYAEYLSINKCW
jgi:hypothetical protein